MSKLSRENYLKMYGPTRGDRVRLGDTDLFIEVERDLIEENGGYGNEVKFGPGNVIRDGMGQSPVAPHADSLDLVLTNALILDAVNGVIKADIGIKHGRIVGIGHAGNPLVQGGITMTIGAGTEVIAAEGCIVTAGGIDSHVQFVSAEQIGHALASGITTMLGGGTGLASGTSLTPGVWNLSRMLEAAEAYPMNFGFFAKGNCSLSEPLVEQIRAGAIGFKLDESWGSTPMVVDNCLSVADQFGVQVLIHTDTLNESGYIEDTIAALKGRVVHAVHAEGTGGGHAPDNLKLCGESRIMCSSSSSTLPFTVNTVNEQLDMLMAGNHLDPSIPEDVAYAESRIRPETIAAENLLQDSGAISMISSGGQTTGRTGELILRTWQTADQMKRKRGPISGSGHDAADNFRALRYIAKYTINPAICHGLDGEVGSIEVGKLADLVVWKPAFFGVKPELVLKGGLVAVANVGDPNASIPQAQPTFCRPQFAVAGTKSSASVTFVSSQSLQNNLAGSLKLSKRLVAVKNTRNLSKGNMRWNDAIPRMEVDPETYTVRADGEDLNCEPATVAPLAQRYFLF